MQIFPKHPDVSRGEAFTYPSVEAQGHAFESYRRKVLGTGQRGSVCSHYPPSGKRIRYCFSSTFLFQASRKE